MDLKSTLLLTGGSACCFKLLNTVIGVLPTPQPAQRKAWKWRNISTSLAHSCLTGAGAVSCFYLQPQMMEDLISFSSLHSHILVIVSTGYFIHDFLDMALNQPFKQSWDLLLHHSLSCTRSFRRFLRNSDLAFLFSSVTGGGYLAVISCFGLAAMSRLYLGFAVMSLLVEINSVFLHLRQLLLLSGRRNRPATELAAPPPRLAYSITSWLNLGTFLVFRVCTLGWMSRWLAGHSEHIPRYVLMMGFTGLSLISIMNIVMFYKMFKADILSNIRNTRGNH